MRGAALLAVLLTYVQVPVVYAHALLERSQPAAGAVLSADSQLGQISLWFSEPVSVTFNAISILDGENRRVDKLDAHVDPADPTRVDVSLAGTGQGAYLVRWQATSADNHVVRGSYWFAVGFATAPPPGALATSDSPAVPPLELTGRVLVLVAVLGLAGAAFFRLLVGRPVDAKLGAPVFESALARKLQTRVWLALAAVFCLGQLAWAAAQAESIAGVPVPQALLGGVPTIVFFGSGFGVLWWARLALGLLLAAVLLVSTLAQPPRSVWGTWLPVILGGLLILSISLGGHASAARVLPILAVGVDVTHLIAAAVWLGGLLQVACLLPAMLAAAPGQRSTLLRALVPRISTVALTSVAVLIATGLFSAWEQVASFEALLDTPYGQSLLVKIGLLTLLLATAAVNLLYVRPRATSGRSGASGALPRRFHQLVVTEVLLGAMVLVAVGTLSSLPPPGSASLPATVESTRQAGDLRVTLNVDPNWVGVSRFRVTLIDQRGNPPADVQNVVYTFAMQGMNMGRTTVFATPVGAGVYEADGFYVGMPGVSQVGVSVSRSNATDEAAVFLVDVPDLNHKQFDGLRASLAVGPLGLLGLMLAVLACAGAVVWRRGSARPGAFAIAAVALAVLGGGAFVADSSGAVNASSAAVMLPPGVSDPTRGKALYEDHCIVCHGQTGIGNGPAAASLLPPPSDLTLHARWHPDEQLYWFISNGVAGTAMPAWADQLAPTERRDVIGYLHELANAPTASPLVAPALLPPSTAQQPQVVAEPTAAAVQPSQTVSAAATPTQALATVTATSSPIVGLSGRLAFGPDNDGNLWVWNFPDEKPEKLTAFGPGEYSSNPVWSPDGSRIAFSYYKLPRTGAIPIPDGTDLYLAKANGTEPHLLAQHDAKGVALQFPAWSPDGKSIYVSYRDLGGTEAHIDRVDIESGNRTKVVTNAGYPTISPDGKRLAYATSPAAGPQQGGTTLMWSSPEGEDPHVILGPQVFQKFYGLRISPDGQRLLFAAIGAGNNYVPPQAGLLNTLGALARNFEPAVAYADGEIYDLWTIGLDGRDLRRITQLAEDLPIGAWAPDGHQIAFLGGGSANIARSGLAVLNADGTGLRRLTGVPGHRGLDWSSIP